MPTRKRRIYWDAACIIALLNREATTEEKYLTAIEGTFEEMLDGKLLIVTSDVFRTEVFVDKDDRDAQAVYNNLLGCDSFVILDVRTPMFDLAGQLRQRCGAKRRKLKTADALHVAAGSLGRVDEIWTTDNKLVRYHTDGLLTETPVCLPHLRQLRLRFE